MNQDKHVLFDREGAVGILTVSQPETLNALSTPLLVELKAVVASLASDRSLKALVITGAGRAFVAGADIAEMSKLSAEGAKDFARLGAEVFRMIELLPFPVIAAVNGFALGGGCELSLACDIRVASSKAKFGQPEVGLGITPGFSGTQRLSRLVGSGFAKELIYTARVIKADEAKAIGLVNDVVEPEELMSVALDMARRIAMNSASAVALSKEAINRGLETDVETGIAYEQLAFSLCFATEDQKEGMQAFLEKRKPDFR